MCLSRPLFFSVLDFSRPEYPFFFFLTKHVVVVVIVEVIDDEDIGSMLMSSIRKQSKWYVRMAYIGGSRGRRRQLLSPMEQRYWFFS